MSDIEAMFHQVRVFPDHRDFLRFLWWPESDLTQDPVEYRMRVHLFGAVSSPSCCNFAIQRAAEDHAELFNDETIETVRRNFYEDDCLKSVENDIVAITLVNELRKLLAKAGFRLTKWLSNSRPVIEAIPESERAVTTKNLDLEDLPIERALGIQWNIQLDVFGFKITIKSRPSTRRGILSIVSSIYDPLGLAAPFILPAKLILQELCRRGIDWDDPIPEEYRIRWERWLAELPKLSEFMLNRCLKPTDFGQIVSCQLHHFSDASLNAYGAVSYVRIVNKDGRIHCAFLIGKSRVAPLKPMTVPRLELSAATVSVRLDKMERRELELPVDDSMFWTDSTSVLRYVENQDKRFNTFVSNRIGAIRSGSSSSQWKHVDGKSNPADDASRGLTADNFLNNTRWLQGPEFLWQPVQQWPKRTDDIGEVPSDDPEVKKDAITYASVAEDVKSVDQIIEQFSSWNRLKKFVAWILRYKRNLLEACRNRKQKLLRKDNRENVIKSITVNEMKTAEKELLKHVQGTNFPEELASCRASNQSVRKMRIKKTSTIFKLDPLLIDDLLRVGGRLRRSSVPEDAKHQIIVPKRHHITDLIVRHYHQISGHSGREYVLSLLRGKFWVIHANSTVRRLLSRCVDCRKRQGLPGEQKMSDLPTERVTADQPPFTEVGVDFFGPFFVKRGRAEVKRYGCIFTCLSTRAIHIEITHSLDTSSFINALRRFIARRGNPAKIRSDNGTNFVSGEKEIRLAIKAWNHNQIHEFLLQRETQWLFNPPTEEHRKGV